MYVERNNIWVRGSNARGSRTSYGIAGGVYARDNYIHGDDANPAGNAVQQVGIYTLGPCNNTVTRNTFERLDQGIGAGVDAKDGYEYDLSGNLFRDVVAGISFFTYYTASMAPEGLFVRCNSFENPGGLTGVTALNVVGPNFPARLGASSTGNGNRFVTAGLPVLDPITNAGNLPFIYYRVGASVQEDLSQGPSLPQGYTVLPTGGNPLTICAESYSQGIAQRAQSLATRIGDAALQQAYDSLGVAGLAPGRQTALQQRVLAAITQRQDWLGLEAYLTQLPHTADRVHAELGGALLAAYRTAHRTPDAPRFRAALLKRHAAEPARIAYVPLWDALDALQRGPRDQPDPTALALLRAVAGSGTPAARVACPIIRRYERACPCQVPTPARAQFLAVPPTTRPAAGGAGWPYPNPVAGSTRVPYVLPPAGGPAFLDVHNAFGQRVLHALLPTATGFFAGELALDVRSWPAGLYK